MCRDSFDKRCRARGQVAAGILARANEIATASSTGSGTRHRHQLAQAQETEESRPTYPQPYRRSRIAALPPRQPRRRPTPTYGQGAGHSVRSRQRDLSTRRSRSERQSALRRAERPAWRSEMRRESPCPRPRPVSVESHFRSRACRRDDCRFAGIGLLPGGTRAPDGGKPRRQSSTAPRRACLGRQGRTGERNERADFDTRGTLPAAPPAAWIEIATR